MEWKLETCSGSSDGETALRHCVGEGRGRYEEAEACELFVEFVRGEGCGCGVVGGVRGVIDVIGITCIIDNINTIDIIGIICIIDIIGIICIIDIIGIIDIIDIIGIIDIIDIIGIIDIIDIIDNTLTAMLIIGTLPITIITPFHQRIDRRPHIPLRQRSRRIRLEQRVAVHMHHLNHLSLLPCHSLNTTTPRRTAAPKSLTQQKPTANGFGLWYVPIATTVFSSRFGRPSAYDSRSVPVHAGTTMPGTIRPAPSTIFLLTNELV